MKKKTKTRKGLESDEIGDAWTFTAIESNSKLILAWHLGHRSYEDTVTFTDKIAYATAGSFQISTDGFPAYRDAVVMSLGMQRVPNRNSRRSTRSFARQKPHTFHVLLSRVIWGFKAMGSQTCSPARAVPGLSCRSSPSRFSPPGGSNQM